MNLLHTLDHFFYARFTRDWPAARIEGYVAALRVDDETSPIPNVVGRTFQIIDGKASALLNHTSMMVAALGVSATVIAQSRIEEAIIIAEISAYLIIAVLCLRCLSLFHESPEEDGAGLAEAIRQEIILRRGLYSLCNRATIYLTVIVLFSLPLLFLYVGT
jgi:hypothetical protein